MCRRAPLPGATRAHAAALGVLVPLLVRAGRSVGFGVYSSLPESRSRASATGLRGSAR